MKPPCLASPKASTASADRADVRTNIGACLRSVAERVLDYFVLLRFNSAPQLRIDKSRTFGAESNRFDPAGRHADWRR